MRENTIFVAGAGGAIGRPLCRLLVDEGYRVVGTTRKRDRLADLENLGVIPVIVDVFDAEKLRRAVIDSGAEIVVHQLTDLPAGLDPAHMPAALLRNARLRDIGTKNLVAAAAEANVRLMVAQSIAFAYAPGPQPHAESDPLNVSGSEATVSARAVANMEQQVLNAAFEGIVLRYGKLYGPGTGFDNAPMGGPVHVDAAADAARRAVVQGGSGVFNVAEEDGAVSVTKFKSAFGWDPEFRLSK